MQPPNNDPSTAIRAFGNALKVVLPILALVATGLGIGLKRWDEDNKRPTITGYVALITGVLVAVVSVASWWTDDWVKQFDNKASNERLAAAVEEQKRGDQELRDKEDKTLGQLQIQKSTLEITNKSLEDTNSAQRTALSIALRQLPIDEIELWFKRDQIEAVLPRELKSETFAFQKPLGEALAGSFDPEDMRIVFEIASNKNLSMLEAFKVGRNAMDSFHSVSRGICKIEITPASINGVIPRLRVGGDYYLTDATLNRQFLRYGFAPDNLPAAYFYGSRARFEIHRPVAAAVGSAEVPKLASCVTPQELRLRIRTFGFVADTGFVDPGWKQEFGLSVGFSRMLKFTASEARNQPSPAK